MAGAGASYPATERLSVFLNFGIDLGLTNLDQDPGGNLKNRAFFGSLGAALPLR